MPKLSSAEVQAAWQRLSQRYGWALAGDESVLIERALAESDLIDATNTPQDLAKVCVWRAYGALLYDGLRRRDERAAQDLWRAFMGLARRGGYPPEHVEDLAQEAIARVLIKLPTLKTPASMLTWALRVFHSVAREQAARAVGEAQPYAYGDDERAPEPADTRDIALDAEQRVIVQMIADRLLPLLPNPLERETLLRVVLLGEKPRDVAHDLGLPLHRTRLAKSRALERVRQDATLLAFLRELAGGEAQPSPGSGADDNDTEAG